ncbi:MAG: hybrid sensor histidine kinase/response regulator [Gammaproteobacteria bacterium]|nr:hybrid sensor histidine kinase/response regulator [Gammaproteobacteria bacterium]
MGNKNQTTILIVDDHPANLDLLECFLEGFDYRLLRAESGKDALALASENDLDLVLLDIMMPEMDGYQVCEKFKEMPQHARVPVIFLTALEDIESKVKAFSRGAVDYLTKPINVKELQARVTTHLRLAQQEQDLKDYDKAKNQFISMLAEDLLTPIQSLKSVLQRLNETSADLDKEALCDYISLAYSAADCINDISHNLKFWSALQNNELTNNQQNVNVKEVFDSIISDIQLETKHKAISIVNDINADEIAYVDEEFLRIIVQNVLSNAVSYSNKGGVVVVVAEDSNIDGSVTITIEDNGIGISEENIQNIFQLGQQFRREGTAGEVGTGMGLILCHDLLEKCGGRMWLESELGKGTKVFINLPQQSNN